VVPDVNWAGITIALALYLGPFTVAELGRMLHDSIRRTTAAPARSIAARCHDFGLLAPDTGRLDTLSFVRAYRSAICRDPAGDEVIGPIPRAGIR